jgi:hypothetical protein
MKPNQKTGLPPVPNGDLDFGECNAPVHEASQTSTSPKALELSCHLVAMR